MTMSIARRYWDASYEWHILEWDENSPTNKQKKQTKKLTKKIKVVPLVVEKAVAEFPFCSSGCLSLFSQHA